MATVSTTRCTSSRSCDDKKTVWLSATVSDQAFEAILHDGVEARRRLIENQQLRSVEQRLELERGLRRNEQPIT